MNLKYFLSFALLAALVACGGDGGGVPPQPTGSISGTLVYPGAIPDSVDTAANVSLTKTGSATVTPDRRLSPIVPGELIVQFRPGLRLESRSALSIGGQELRLERSLRLPSGTQFQLYKSSGLDEAGTLRLAAQLRSSPDVLSVTPNRMKYALKVPNDGFYPYQWHYPAMNLPAAWDIEDGTSNAVTVAVLDTGIIEHPDLVPNLLPGYDFVSDISNSGDGDGIDSDPTDLGGDTGYHGSHVAGTIAAATNNGSKVAGVSWNAKIVPIRVLGVAGGSNFDILQGVLWAAGFPVQNDPNSPTPPQNANPAKVLNLSLGGEGPCEAFEEQIYGELKNAGIIVAVAAGNDNDDAGAYSPADCDNVITVGATGPTNERSYYSNYGSEIDIMAPGGDLNYTFDVSGQSFPAGVLSTVRFDDSNAFGEDFYQGTSMASPHIAGLLALMAAQDPSLTFDAALQRLQASATVLSPETCGRPSAGDCGPGLVDAAKALGSGGGNPGDPGNPPAPPPTGNLTTYIAAFFCAAPNCGLPNNLVVDETRSVIYPLQNANSLQVPFSIPGLSGGTYIAAAWQDVDNDGIVDDREPFGVYGVPIFLAEGQQLQNVTIYLEAYSASSQRVSPVDTEATLWREAFQRVLEQPRKNSE